LGDFISSKNVLRGVENTVYVQNILKNIGNTPLFRMERIARAFSCTGHLFGKAEFMNPSGSVKDRAAYYMVRDALEMGMIGRDGTVIAATGGSSAVSLAMVCAGLQISCVIVMPDDAPEYKINAPKLYGAKVLLTPAAGGMSGALEACEKLRLRLPQSVVLDFFESESAVQAHREGTGEEILRDLDTVDVLIAGVGTGATLTGCGEVIKRQFPECRIVAVEPSESAVLSGGEAGAHKISGIGAGIIPPMLNTYLLDEVIRVRSVDALDMCRMLAKSEGILCSPSSGAVMAAAVNVGKRPEMRSCNIVCILPERGENAGIPAI